MSASPKNLLILISDEHRKDAMGCAGHAIVKTPNLDQLAAHGTLFENAYTPSPMCVPTRASIACGDHVHRIGHWDSATPYDGKHRSWMHELRDRGFAVTSIGKLHFRSADDDNGFTEEILPMHVVGGVGWTVGLLRENPPSFDACAELARDVGAGESSYTAYDRAITEAAEAWMAERGQTGEAGPTGKATQPWAAFVSFVSPHYPLMAPEEFYHLYDPATVDLPFGHDEASRPDHPELRNIAKFYDYDRHFDAASLRQARAAYYGLTSFMDDCVGRVLAALRASGQADETLVIYISDHGDMMGDLGFWTKQVMYEASAGVPMIVAGPGIPAGHRVRTGTTLLDIAATAFDVAGMTGEAAATSRPGRSLLYIANQPDDFDRTIFSEYHDGGSTTGTFMLRWAEWKYIHYVGYPPQLFNLWRDPHELVNLAVAGVNDLEVRAAWQEGERRLRAICDPEAVNRQCFAEQQRRIAELGGVEACASNYNFNHTPTPSEQAEALHAAGGKLNQSG